MRLPVCIFSALLLSLSCQSVTAQTGTQKPSTTLSQSDVASIRKEAGQGDAAAQDRLGSMYRIGQGVQQDYAQAVAWWRKAAEQGCADAQNMLGRAYEQGEGVPQNYARAAVWYRNAAEQGDALAQWSLGSMYERGNGVPQDHAAAYFWLNLAAASKIIGARQEEVAKERDDAATFLTPSELSEAQVRARKWAESHSAEADTK